MPAGLFDTSRRSACFNQLAAKSIASPSFLLKSGVLNRPEKKLVFRRGCFAMSRFSIAVISLKSGDAPVPLGQ